MSELTEERLAEIEASYNNSLLHYPLYFDPKAMRARLRIEEAVLEIGILGMKAIPAMIAEVRRLRAGLAEIACYGEGPAVTGKFDEPTAVRLARKILEGS
jgi:hypothetical protein